MKVDVSPEAVTQRMEIQNQLWELTIELQKAVIVDEKTAGDEQKNESNSRDNQN